MPIVDARHVIDIRRDLCTVCGLCILACPEGCLQLWPDPDRPDARTLVHVAADCRGDGLCLYACPRPGALSLLETA